MGIPRFYRWLSERYPLINVRLDGHAVCPPVDNLYIDMNSVVHNCARGDPFGDSSDAAARYFAVKTGDMTPAGIYLRVFKYINLLFSLVHPRKLVYLAVDGVAPRAKMNQQRARRFRSAKEREEERQERMETDVGFRVGGMTVFDSNCITPGTEFMMGLTEALEYFVHRRMTEDEEWGNLQVVLSGAEAPGEGEHKIMDYIRKMKLSGRLGENMSHCIYGLDADLIVLALVTHEPQFILLREKVDFEKYRPKRGPTRVKSMLDTAVLKDEFELLSINVLRDYFAVDFGTELGHLSFYDLERIIDDFVMLMLFVGNDFLPNLPKIEIHGGSLNAIIRLYKCLIPKLGGYLSEAGSVNPGRFEIFVSKLARLELIPEKPPFRRREGRYRQRRPANAPSIGDTEDNSFWEIEGEGDEPWSEEQIFEYLDAATAGVNGERSEGSEAAAQGSKPLASPNFSYYKKKLGLEKDLGEKLEELKRDYVKGVCWILKYYYEGVASWRWFYPHLYPPMASDLTGLQSAFESVSFPDDVPFKPMEQLLSVLPPVSRWCLPTCFAELMTKGSIAQYFPMNFEVDMNGKRNDWEGIVLLPFIPEEALLAAMARINTDKLLTEREKRRNTLGHSRIYTRSIDNLGRGSDVQSPFPNRLPNFLSLARSAELILQEQGETKGFQPIVSEKQRQFALARPTPTLSSISHAGRLTKDCAVNVFGYPSSWESLVIQVRRSEAKERDFVFFDSDSEEDKHTEGSDISKKHWRSAKEAVESGFLIGRRIITGYPWHCEGILETVADKNSSFERASAEADSSANFVNMGGVTVIERSTVSAEFDRSSSSIMAAHIDHQALDLGELKVLFGVRKAVERNLFTGRVIKYSESVSHVAAATVIKASGTEDQDENIAESVEVEGNNLGLPGHKVICIFPGPHFGSLGVVEKVTDDNVYVRFSLSARAAKEPPFAYRVIGVLNREEAWMPAGRLARALDLPKSVVVKLVGSVRVRVINGDSRDEEMDLGLGIKYSSRGVFIPGYARREREGVYLYSRKTKDLLMAYCRAFPEFIKRLTTHATRDDGPGEKIFSLHDLFPGKNSMERLQSVAGWVGASEVASLPLISVESEVLSKTHVLALGHEAGIATELQGLFSASSRGPTTIKLPRKSVISSQSRRSSLSKEEARRYGPLRLGDRVVNWKGAGSVPFGLRGTVVGVHKNRIVEVIFDESFIGGGNLNGRCTENRGKAVDDDSLLLVRPTDKLEWYDRHYNRVKMAYEKKHGPLGKYLAQERNSRIELALKFVHAYKSYAQGSISAPTSAAASHSQQPVSSKALISAKSARGVATAGSRLLSPESGKKEAGMEYCPSPSDLPLPKFLSKMRGSQTHGVSQKAGAGSNREGPRVKTLLRRGAMPANVKTPTTRAGSQSKPVDTNLNAMTQGLKSIIGIGTNVVASDGTGRKSRRDKIDRAPVRAKRSTSSVNGRAVSAENGYSEADAKSRTRKFKPPGGKQPKWRKKPVQHGSKDTSGRTPSASRTSAIPGEMSGKQASTPNGSAQVDVSANKETLATQAGTVGDDETGCNPQREDSDDDAVMLWNSLQKST